MQKHQTILNPFEELMVISENALKAAEGDGASREVMTTIDDSLERVLEIAEAGKKSMNEQLVVSCVETSTFLGDLGKVCAQKTFNAVLGNQGK